MKNNRHDRETITSLQNPRVKEVTALQSSSSLRREKGLFVVEGLREVERCVENGFRLRSVFYCPGICRHLPDSFGSYDFPGTSDSFERSSDFRLFPHSFRRSNDNDSPSERVQRTLHHSTPSEGVAFSHIFPTPSEGVSCPTPPSSKGTTSKEATTAPSPSAGARIFEVSEAVYGKMAYRGGTEGILAVVCGSAQDRSLEALDLTLFGGSGTKRPDPEYAPLIVVVESVEKPGNLGAMLRTADASGVSAVLVCDPHTDLYNPNLIRASLGGVFTRNIAVCTSEEAIAWLKSRSISILTAQLQDSELYYDTDMVRSTALVFGTEADGLTDIWRRAADAHIRIPMLGRIDSLNVSASMAVLCYEALRQRHTRMASGGTDTTSDTTDNITADRASSDTTAGTPDGICWETAAGTADGTSSSSGSISQQ